MSAVKRNPGEPVPNRTSRYIEQAGGWLVRTREGVPLGPYATKFDAELASHLLISRLTQARTEAECRSIIGQFLGEAPIPVKGQSTPAMASESATQTRGRRKADQSRWTNLIGVANRSVSDSLQAFRRFRSRH